MEVFNEIRGTLQDMQADTKGLRVDVTRRLDTMDGNITKLLGAFASIERMLTDHTVRLADHEARLRRVEGAA